MRLHSTESEKLDSRTYHAIFDLINRDRAVAGVQNLSFPDADLLLFRITILFL